MDVPMNAPWRVTAAPRTGAEGHAAAAEIAVRLGLQQIRRGNRSLGSMTRAHGPGGWLIVHPRHGLHGMTPDGTPWRWHPGLARTRVSARAAGHPDPLLQALGLPRDAPLRLLDVNLGQGHDAMVASDGGADVVGLEIDAVVHAITTDGLARCDHPVLQACARRIQTRCGDQAKELAALPNDSFDAVLFSPMYLAPEFHAEDLVQLRQVAQQGWPSDETFAEALRVAPLVVVKVEPGRHPELPHVTRWLGGRRRVAWAIMARPTVPPPDAASASE